MLNKVYQVPYGTKDILPGEMKRRRKIENAILDIFENWGYEEVKTPGFEYADTFGSMVKDSDFRFFDRNNNLLVLRNDMTAPIARLAATRLQQEEGSKRLCYFANLYRYEEIQMGRQCEFEQAGVEFFGAQGAEADAEIIALAVQALQATGLETFAFSVGHVGFINGLAEEVGFNAEQIARLKDCLRRHDAVGLQELADSMEEITPEIKKLFADFLFLQGGVELLDELSGIVQNEKCLAALQDLRQIYELVEKHGAGKFVSFNLGLYRALDYYTGMLFEVYVPDMGYPVAGGGRYDKMMRGFGLDCPATGFAIGVDRVLLALDRNTADEYITIAMPKGKLFKKSYALLEKVGFSGENVVEDSRKLVITNEEAKVRFIIAKTVDVHTYVEHGAADIGFIGKDVLLEENKDVVELLDLGFGKCRLMMAVPEKNQRAKLTDYAHIRVATKYPNCARTYFNKLGVQNEIVKLNGSIELGPLIGLSEVIVDIVETGTTLRENNLVEVDSIFTATARLIANRASFKLKFARLHKLVEDLRVVLNERDK